MATPALAACPEHYRISLQCIPQPTGAFGVSRACRPFVCLYNHGNRFIEELTRHPQRLAQLGAAETKGGLFLQASSDSRPAGAMTETQFILRALQQLPDTLRSRVERRWQTFSELHAEQALLLATDPEIAASLPGVWAASEFVAGLCDRHPDDVDFLIGSHGVATPWQPGSLPGRAAEQIAGADNETDLMRALRVFRRRESARAAWRDLAGWSSLEETLGHTSELADVCIRHAVQFAESMAATTHGQPVDTEGRPMGLIVLAMGKLGGRELNFSSDIDLIFLFQESGSTSGRRPISFEQFFIRVGQRVIRALDQVTEDGLVYRVDMRLRPFGDSGPLAISLPALEQYLQKHGRAWERYAYLKARPLTGHRPGSGLYRDLLRPFVYRRYLDYGVFESLRNLKRRIASETSQSALQDDLKRGRGGIREVEFIVQSYQILRGGSDAGLRDPHVLTVLPRLAAAHHVTGQVADDIEAAYRFLRRMENHLQQWRDKQVHRVPEDSGERERLAFSLGFADWASCGAELELHRQRIQQYFHETFAVSADAADDEQDDPARQLWTGDLPRESAEAMIRELGFEQPEPVLTSVARLRHASFLRRLDSAGRQRLDDLMPALIGAAARHEDSEVALERLIRVVESVGLRSAYLALLNENPQALTRLTDLCGHSDFLARQIEMHPLLLDELIDPRVFESLPQRVELDANLSQRLAALPADELEGQMETLRRFQRSAVFLVAVADLGGLLPVMKVSDRLTEIAECVLEAAVKIAWSQLAQRHGTPHCGAGGDRRETGFGVIGYGKLGGIELGYGSDLDLVFVHDSDGPGQVTDGEVPLDNGLFFGRLARRIVHLLTTQTASGLLYEVDTRLRPSGKGGLLVTSLRAFEAYQRGEAWTWEQQALLRARAVAGDVQACQAFEALRRRVLCEAVRRDALREDVRRMRSRMLAETGSKDISIFDIKADRGGIADIEFIVQYSVLAGAADHPALVVYSDNVRQLESLVAAGLMDEVLAASLRDAYLAFRDRLHSLSLERRAPRVPATELSDHRQRVVEVWHDLFDG